MSESHWGSSTSFLAHVISCLNFGLPDSWEMLSHCSFNLHFSNDIWSLFFSSKSFILFFLIVPSEFIYLLKITFYCVSITVVPIFPLCPPLPIPPPTPTITSHTVVHVSGSFIHVLHLVPSPSFHHYPPSSSPLVTFSQFHVSMPVVLFCLNLYCSLLC